MAIIRRIKFVCLKYVRIKYVGYKVLDLFASGGLLPLRAMVARLCFLVLWVTAMYACSPGGWGTSVGVGLVLLTLESVVAVEI